MDTRELRNDTSVGGNSLNWQDSFQKESGSFRNVGLFSLDTIICDRDFVADFHTEIIRCPPI